MDMRFLHDSSLSHWELMLIKEVSPNPEGQARDLFTC